MPLRCSSVLFNPPGSVQHDHQDRHPERLGRHRERPAREKNALTQAMYSAMADALVAAQADPAVRVVLITGQPGCFTSGNDLEDC